MDYGINPYLLRQNPIQGRALEEIRTQQWGVIWADDMNLFQLLINKLLNTTHIIRVFYNNLMQ